MVFYSLELYMRTVVGLANGLPQYEAYRVSKAIKTQFCSQARRRRGL